MPKIVKPMPESQSNLRKNKFVLTNLKKLSKSGVLSVQNKRRGGANIEFRLESGNVRKSNINSLTSIKMLSEFDELVE